MGRSLLRMSYLQRLLGILRGLISRRSRSIAVEVAPSEPLARFLFESSKYSVAKGSVSPRAFLPDTRGETSVFRIAGLLEGEVWSVGRKIRELPAVARADIAASSVTAQALRVIPETSDFENHAVIVDWPTEKHAKLMKATLLAQASILRLPAP